MVADALSREHFVQPSVFLRLTQVPYGTLLEKRRALNHDCVQDVFRLSCHPFGLVRDGRPGTGPSVETILAPEWVVRHMSPDSYKLLTDLPFIDEGSYNVHFFVHLLKIQYFKVVKNHTRSTYPRRIEANRGTWASPHPKKQLKVLDFTTH